MDANATNLVQDQPIVPAEEKNLIVVLAEAEIEAEQYLKAVGDFVVDSNEMFDVATIELTNIRVAEKNMEAARDALVRPLNTEVKWINAAFKKPSEKLVEAKAIIGKKMIDYENAQRALRDAAEKRAEAERAKAMESAQAKLDSAAESGKSDEIATAEENFLLASIGNSAGVEELASRGNHQRRITWKAVVTDLPAFVAHAVKSAAEGDTTCLESIELKLGNISKLGQASQGRMKIPGITFEKEEKIAAVVRG